MTFTHFVRLNRVLPLATSAALIALAGTSASAQASASAPASQHTMTDSTDQNKQLAAQVADLRAQVAKLQAAVKQMESATQTAPKAAMPMSGSAKKPMGMMDDKKEMGMAAGQGAMSSDPAPMGMKDDRGEMGAMSAPGQTPAPAMGMCCMGEMGSMSSSGNDAMSAKPAAAAGGMASMNRPSSAAPGEAGASHLYHVGSTGFFLDHAQHISLTADQKRGLNRLKEKAMLDRASVQRQIDQAEQELYILTGADAVDAAKVEAKVGEIERLRAEQRVSFIRAVGEATGILTPEQKNQLLGMAGMPAK